MRCYVCSSQLLLYDIHVCQVFPCGLFAALMEIIGLRWLSTASSCHDVGRDGSFCFMPLFPWRLWFQVATINNMDYLCRVSVPYIRLAFLPLTILLYPRLECFVWRNSLPQVCNGAKPSRRDIFCAFLVFSPPFEVRLAFWSKERIVETQEDRIWRDTGSIWWIFVLRNSSFVRKSFPSCCK